jgi:type II secretory pathway pseudopilin PulG
MNAVINHLRPATSSGTWPEKADDSARRTHRAFTFLEVLFAVIIIGVGVVMIAGIFPVAIQQSQANLSESAAIPMGRDALRDLQSLASNYVPPVTAGVNLLTFPPTYNLTLATPAAITTYPIMPIPNTLTVTTPPYAYSSLIYPLSGTPPAGTAPYANLANVAVLSVTGNQILNADRRYGWIGFYRRDMINITVNGAVAAVPAPYAQVWIITGQATTEGQPTYTAPPSIGAANIQTGTLSYVAGTGAILQMPSNTAALPNPAVSNAYALVLNVSTGAGGDAALLGQVVRLGSLYATNTSTNMNIWNLLPGSDLNANDTLLNGGTLNGAYPNYTLGGGGQNVSLFILGSSNDPVTGYGGNAQDLTCTTGFIRVSN